jgi:uridine kinase
MMGNRIEIICKNNGEKISAPMGVSLEELLLLFRIENPKSILAALVNNKPMPLKSQIFANKTVEFIDYSSNIGRDIYVRSVAFMLNKVLQDLFENTEFRIEHSVPSGYYCTIKSNGKNISSEELEKLLSEARKMVEQDLTFEMLYHPKQEVIEEFRKIGNNAVADLLGYSKFYYAHYYKLGDTIDYYHSLLAPSTSYLKLFDVSPIFNGFLLRVPKQADTSTLEDTVPMDKIFEIFQEYIDWNKIVGLEDLPELNAINKEQRAALIKVTEALHEKKISKIAERIAENPKVKIILVSGPSSSGKTTFSKRLSVQLAACKLRPIALSLDNYYLTHDKTPLDEFGELDFESLYALDLPLFNEQLQALLRGEEVQTPKFNFETEKRELGPKIKLNENDVLVIEGIHGLNPELTASIPDEKKFKVYVSALTTLSLGPRNWLSTSDTRLLRRCIRDHKYRNYPAEKTILRWPSVRRGESKWIFPYQENADEMFNSSLLYEISSIKKQAEPILTEVPQDSDAYPTAKRLLNLLQFFTPIPYNEVPNTSLLREFLGGSSFRY